MSYASGMIICQMVSPQRQKSPRVTNILDTSTQPTPLYSPSSPPSVVPNFISPARFLAELVYLCILFIFPWACITSTKNICSMYNTGKTSSNNIARAVEISLVDSRDGDDKHKVAVWWRCVKYLWR